MLKELTFFVPGIPAPGGSKRGFAIKKGGQYTGRVAIVEAAGQRNVNWRQAVVQFAYETMKECGSPPLAGPISMHLTFTMPRPKYHYNKAGLKKDAPQYHTIAPDCTKLTRGTEDAMKGIIFQDDSQVVIQGVCKFYGERPGCMVGIMKL